MDSIKYYNENALKFIENTKDADMGHLYICFEKYLNKGATILDLGCGSGRDSIYFLDKGYDVISVDGSQEMVDYCKSFLHEKVVFAKFEEFFTEKKFDGIWACASLLHVKEEELNEIIQKYIGYLNKGGIFFMSFKEGNANYVKDGRVFTCMTEDKMEKVLMNKGLADIIEIVHTVDVRESRENEKWLSVILKKV